MMVDEVDAANEIVSKMEDIAVSLSRSYKGPEATGYCISPECGKKLEFPQRFCNAECRDAWQKSRRIYGGK